MKGLFYVLNEILEAGIKKIGLKFNTKSYSLLTALLFPVVLVLGVLLIVPILLWNTVAMLCYSLTGTTANIETDGIRLAKKRTIGQQLLLWNDIHEVRQIWKPPFRTLQAVLHSGAIVAIYFADSQVLEAALIQRNIPLIKAFSRSNDVAS